MNFEEYWDTRIDANERFFNENPHIANFTHDEALHLYNIMNRKIKELIEIINAVQNEPKKPECQFMSNWGD